MSAASPFDRWPWQSFDPFETLDRDFAQLLPIARGYPEAAPVNVWASDEGVVVMAEVPGLRPADIDLMIEHRRLGLRGRSGVHSYEESATYIHRGRSRRVFERSIDLPFEVDIERVEATLRDGILWVQLHRAATDRRRKVAIRSA